MDTKGEEDPVYFAGHIKLCRYGWKIDWLGSFNETSIRLYGYHHQDWLSLPVSYVV